MPSTPDPTLPHRNNQAAAELENLIRRLAALYPQEMIGEGLVETELGTDAPVLPTRTAATSMSNGTVSPMVNGAGVDEVNLSMSVERHLSGLFKSHGDGLPPPGLYHRILREIEYPLITAALAATRGNQIKAAELLGLNRNTLRKKVRDLDIRLMRSPR